uniref:phosphatidyl-N-methylethanolamine N-methyltransferase n=1 Tax=Lygus hesperus TaxID=30085 RepID=A0A0A9Z3P9_LYGHE
MQANAHVRLLPATLPFCASVPSRLSDFYASHLPQLCKGIGLALLATGTSLVASAFARLGIVNTYLGDYFGFTMDKKVTAFPFNVLNSPMYTGASLNFFGAAVR